MLSSRRTFLSGGLAMAGAAGAVDQAGAAPPRIGVVNVRTCFDKEQYARVKESLEEIGKLRDQLAREGTDLQKRIVDLADQMNQLARNGELYVEKVRQRAHAEYDLKLLQEVANRKVRDRMNDMEWRVFGDLRRVVAQLARALNLDLVLRADEPRPASEDLEAPLRIASRDVLFHQDALDLTPRVIAQLNADWAKAWPCAACKRKVADAACPDCGAKRP